MRHMPRKVHSADRGRARETISPYNAVRIKVGKVSYNWEYCLIIIKDPLS